MAITIYELAEHRLGENRESTESLNGGEICSVGLPFWGGCEVCGASIAAYNAYPSKSGYLRCSEDIWNDGWDSVEEADEAIQQPAG